MILGAAFVPETPLLVPQVGQGAAPELDELRAACRAALATVAALSERICVVGSGPARREYPAGARGTLAGFGVPLTVALGGTANADANADADAAPTLPLSLTVGAWLLADALGRTPGVTACSVTDADDSLPGLDDAALVVVGDGSARRSTAAPGYLDERAGAFDAAVARALAAGDPAALHVDAVLGAQLLAGGIAAWHAAARAMAGHRYDAQLLYDAAPYGVGYFAAVWTPRG